MYGINIDVLMYSCTLHLANGKVHDVVSMLLEFIGGKSVVYC